MDYTALVVAMLPSAVAITLLSVAVLFLGHRVSRLADRIERLEDAVHDQTCHPADRVGTAQRQRADGISPFIVAGFNPDRRGRL